MKQNLNPAMAKVLKRLHYPLDVILMCVRWYVAYSLSLRNLEEMMAERGIEVDHSSVYRWVIKLVPLFEKAFRRSKRPNNIIEQDHRAIKRIIRPMMGFKNFRCARIILSGIEVMHMIRKGQMKDDDVDRTVAAQFYLLVM